MRFHLSIVRLLFRTNKYPVSVDTCFYLYSIYPYVCVCRMKKRSGVGSRQTSRQQWLWPMTSRWRLSRSCVHSGGSCRRSRIAVQSFPQTLRPCRESGIISSILLFFSSSPSTKPPGSPCLASGCSSFLSEHNVDMRYLPESCHIPIQCFIHVVQTVIYYHFNSQESLA